MYDGKTGDKIDELAGHSGSIFSLAWSPDSTQLLTSSADCTAKIWDISTKSVVKCVEYVPCRVSIYADMGLLYSTFEINSAQAAVDNQQVGNLWQGDWIITTSLSGQINYLDKNSGKISRVIDGHSKAITALAVSSDDTLFTGSYDGRVYAWSVGTDSNHTEAKKVGGESHSNQVVALEATKDNNLLISAGMDDTVRVGSVDTKSFR